MPSCSGCGKVLEYDLYSDEPTFVKNAAGQSQLAGRNVRSIQSDDSASRARIFENAEYELRCMRNALDMGENEEIVDIAKRFFRIAVDRNFTRGRKSEQVLASCLYIACREKRKPYLLIDFSNYLKINLCARCRVFAALQSLPGGTDKGVIQTAQRIITSMKRDWMQTGRKPSGLCGAALYISALSHGLKCSKSDIIRIVHVCDATLTKRLVEFENTESGSLTIEEFLVKARELEELSQEPNLGVKVDNTDEVLCEHKGSAKPFQYGLCRVCYDDFMQISGGLEGGSNPPAFQRAEIKRLEEASTEENANDSGADSIPCQSLDNSKEILNCEKEPNNSKAESGGEGLQFTEPESVGDDTVKTGVEVGTEDCDEPDNLSDIDDAEVDSYLLNEEGKRYKKMIWEEVNREYIEEQAAKEREAKAAGMDPNCPEDAKKVATAKKKKERQLARAAEARNDTEAQTAAEAVHQMLTKKRLSSKINFDALEDMFQTAEAPDNSKKKKESHPDIDAVMQHEEGLEFDAYKNDENEDDGNEGTGYNILDPENVDEQYDYEDYGYGDDY
ncbi:Cyclin/Brf1-like TBP-binding protein [Prunus dulcis]|uniref:Cyclin/Brf1-like TBP-binding protein n=1 Tax=Prunus dulcis TaxID=3755 RepID=A0A4Y1QNU4_PRUDU|nr:Cyclin/Brf1-like TBP-binding protein [Prunus dulcis]